MPNVSGLSVDSTALMALGFLGAVLLMTIGLFAWIMLQGGKAPKSKHGDPSTH